MATNAASMLSGDNPADELVEYGNSTEVSSNAKAHEMFAVLLTAAPYAHMLHLQTRSNAEHMALGDLYEQLPDLTDKLIESYQGKYGRVEQYPKPNLPELDNPVAMAKQLVDYIGANRNAVAPDSYLQNQIDEIERLLYKTLNKLKFLA